MHRWRRFLFVPSRECSLILIGWIFEPKTLILMSLFGAQSVKLSGKTCVNFVHFPQLVAHLDEFIWCSKFHFFNLPGSPHFDRFIWQNVQVYFGIWSFLSFLSFGKLPELVASLANPNLTHLDELFWCIKCQLVKFRQIMC